MTRSSYRPALGRGASRLLGAVLCTAVLAGCATSVQQHTPPAAEEAVTRLAQQRWDAQLAGEWEKAYSLFTPSYRAIVPLGVYIGQRGTAAQIQAAEVVAVDCASEDLCTAKVRLDFVPLLGARRGPALSTHVDERWVREEGQWWLFQAL